MARRGRVIYKISNNGGRKRNHHRSKDCDDDDDGDEEYVIEEDEEEESESNYESDVNSRDLSDEESFDFDESDGDFEIARSKKKKKRSCKKSRVSDDELIEDLPKRGRGRAKKEESRDSDYEFEEEEDDDEDFSLDEDDFDEDEGLVTSKRRRAVMSGGNRRRSKVSKPKGRKKGSTVASPTRKRQKRMIGSSDDDADDDDFIVKDRVSVGKKSRKRKKKRSSVDSELLESDFVASDDDFMEQDVALINKRRQNRKNVKKTVKKKAAGSKGRRKKRSAEDSDSSDSDFVISDDDIVGEDDNFDMDDHVVVDQRRKNIKKEKVVGFNERKRRKKVVESSDSDYIISENDDEFVADDENLIDKHQNQNKKASKKRTGCKTKGKRSNLLVDSDSESIDFDEMTLEEEVRDLRTEGLLMIEPPKRAIATKKAEEKGKKTQLDESGKQVCGVCLSEEKKSVIQGLLDCCSHYFCFACIMEWSKVESRCPLCKRRFEMITKTGRSDPGFGIRSPVIRVQKRDQVYQPSEEELRGMLDPYENVVCMECQQGGDDNLMLLCDICDSSAHTYCVGLGREVPDGNWYCECCRSVNEGASHSQFQETMPDQGTTNNNFFNSATEAAGGFADIRLNIDSPRPLSLSGRPSSLRIDLNASPRDFPGDNRCVPSPISGLGASTLMGRRQIRQRIHVILSTDRQRRTPVSPILLQPNSVPTVSENRETSSMAGNLSSVLGFEHQQQNPRSFPRSPMNLVPCAFSEGSSLRHVDGAKEEVQKLVKVHLKDLSKNRTVDHSTFKEIARNSTHTILAACGIEHRKSMVSSVTEPPDNCAHASDDGPEHLLKGCCSSCFSAFVKNVVQRLINSKS